MTRGAQAVAGRAVISPAQAALCGLGRVAAAEHPELRFTQVDLDPGAEPGGQAAAVRGDATYLITGGLGGLGLESARLLCGAGARHVVLIGRTPPDADAQVRRSRHSGPRG
ncbi:KR domain-containing protein [Streptomyces sp. NPDC020125]|uniref:KR domain-containing protein n=1 Tax=Streptomyces sp. NPDC020125 TaxID=3154593 RepID=UPI0033DF48D4